MKRSYHQVTHILMSPTMYLFFALICFVSLGYSYQSNEAAARANVVAANEATQRSIDIESQNERLRIAFCGFLEPYANLTTPPATESARILRDTFKRAASNEGIGCTPDPTDGR